MNTHKTLKAYFVRSKPADNKNGILAAWCPYGECVHTHGAAGKGAEPRLENRVCGEHCRHGAGCPLENKSYNLDVVGEVPNLDFIEPRFPMGLNGKRGSPFVTLARLTSYNARPWLDACAWLVMRPKVRVKKYIRLGVPSNPPSKANLWLEPDCGWAIEEKGQPTLKGTNTIALAAALYGVPVQVAGRRLLEAVTGHFFDPDTALALEAVLEDWERRGQPLNRVPR
jgi:hypothetical protein